MAKDTRIHVAFSGGGTGGHLFPGLAVAERLTAMIPQVRISFFGSGKPFEHKHVGRAGFDYFALPSHPLPRRACEAVAFFIENISSYLTAKRILREEQVAAVIGLGGYASAPMAKAAVRSKVPLVLLEQNAIPGKATRWLSRHASLICTAFPDAESYLYGDCPVRVTGNPIRAGFVQSAMPGGRTRILRENRNQAEPSRLLVLGGSGGARALNENVPRALYKIRSQLTDWQIVHQSGEADLEATRSLYAKFDLPAIVVPFIGNMPNMLAASDFAVCRAGGTTLAELAASAVPAILLPYPHATDDHQAANARHFAKSGGCVTIDERDTCGRLDDQLADMLCFLMANEPLRDRMADAMLALAKPNASADVAELIWSIISSRSVTAELAAA